MEELALSLSKEEIEEDFIDWINSNCSPYSFLIEYFYGDCEIQDNEERRAMMYKWLLAAYEEGFKNGQLYPKKGGSC